MSGQGPFVVLAQVEALTSVSVLLSSLELLAQPRLTDSKDLLSWEVTGQRTRWLACGYFARCIQVLMQPKVYLLLHVVRAVSALVLIVQPPSATLRGVCCGLVVFVSLLQVLRSTYGLDGADQLTLHVFGACFLAHVYPTVATCFFVLVYIALQATLAYAVAGAYKLVSPDWRSPNALVGVLRTRIYGTRVIGTWLGSHDRITLILSFGVILGEFALAIAIACPVLITASILAAGVLFHLSTAVFMGLNTFLWAFVGTYPAIIFCSAKLDRVIW